MAKLLDRALPAEKVDEWGFLLTRKELEAIRREAEEKKRIAADYQYYLSCSELHVATLPASQQEEARQGWTKILRPFRVLAELDILNAFKHIRPCYINVAETLSDGKDKACPDRLSPESSMTMPDAARRRASRPLRE